MKSFDQSLKYLLQHRPADFLRFGFGDPALEILTSLPSGLPSRGRDIDGSYRILQGGAELVAHLEFHRRNQKLEDLAVDVAEAQIRLYRRERRQVVSQVWDLYGKKREPVLQGRTLRYGAVPAQGAGSQSLYQRVNLRGMRWKDLLAQGPPALWPLVALTGDGAIEEAIHEARDAIEGRADLSPTEKADHLAVLWFISEAERLPVWMMKEYISEERLMESTLYRDIFAKGKAQGKAEGDAKRCAETIIGILTLRMGARDPALEEQIRALSDAKTLMQWYGEALSVIDADGARRLIEGVRSALRR